MKKTLPHFCFWEKYKACKKILKTSSQVDLQNRNIKQKVFLKVYKKQWSLSFKKNKSKCKNQKKYSKNTIDSFLSKCVYKKPTPYSGSLSRKVFQQDFFILFQVKISCYV